MLPSFYLNILNSNTTVHHNKLPKSLNPQLKSTTYYSLIEVPQIHRTTRSSHQILLFQLMVKLTSNRVLRILFSLDLHVGVSILRNCKSLEFQFENFVKFGFCNLSLEGNWFVFHFRLLFPKLCMCIRMGSWAFGLIHLIRKKRKKGKNREKPYIYI